MPNLTISLKMEVYRGLDKLAQKKGVKISQVIAEAANLLIEKESKKEMVKGERNTKERSD